MQQRDPLFSPEYFYQVEWKHKGEDIKTGWISKLSDFSMETSENSSTLVIKKVGLDKAGQYTVQIENDLGNDWATCDVIVKGICH